MLRFQHPVVVLHEGQWSLHEWKMEAEAGVRDWLVGQTGPVLLRGDGGFGLRRVEEELGEFVGGDVGAKGGALSGPWGHQNRDLPISGISADGDESFHMRLLGAERAARKEEGELVALDVGMHRLVYIHEDVDDLLRRGILPQVDVERPDAFSRKRVYDALGGLIGGGKRDVSKDTV